MVSNSALRAGMKVVYVKAYGSAYGVKPLELGNVYTIRSITSGDTVGADCDGIRLEEVVNGLSPIFGWERHYNAPSFRPVVTKTQEQDVGMFKELTNDIPPSARLDLLAELLNQ